MSKAERSLLDEALDDVAKGLAIAAARRDYQREVDASARERATRSVPPEEHP